jgi:hypothetical protein
MHKCYGQFTAIPAVCAGCRESANWSAELCDNCKISGTLHKALKCEKCDVAVYCREFAENEKSAAHPAGHVSYEHYFSRDAAKEAEIIAQSADPDEKIYTQAEFTNLIKTFLDILNDKTALGLLRDMLAHPNTDYAKIAAKRGISRQGVRIKALRAAARIPMLAEILLKNKPRRSRKKNKNN